MNFDIKIDSSGQKYIEVETLKEVESLRISYIKDGFTEKPCLRFNIHRYGKGLRQGPEFSLDKTPDIMAAISQLLIEIQNDK